MSTVHPDLLAISQYSSSLAMIAALDSTPLMEKTGGLSRYTRELSRALAESFPEDLFYLLSDQDVVDVPEGCQNLRARPRRSGWINRRWWSVGLPLELRRISAAVFHGTDFAVPYMPFRPSVMTLHDLSPWMDTAWHSDARRVRRRAPLLLGLGLATMVITPSEAVRRQAIERFRLDSGRVVAVPHAAATHLRPQPPCPHRSPYFLYVGTLEPRKNLGMLIKAWQAVRQDHPVDLMLAGRRRADCPVLPELPGLHIMGPVGEDELSALYSGAAACVYPSLYEGFGLPVLEAMQCGAPVIASDDAAVFEVAGDAATLLPPADSAAWVDALRTAVSSEQWRLSWREKALRRAGEFSWRRTAERTREVYLEATRRFGY